MNEQLELIKLVADRLEKAGIPYMITGSAALDFYAQPRMTRDVDLVVELKPSDAPVLCKLFSPDFYLDETAVQQAARDHGMFNAIHNDWMIKVDFIIRKDSEYRRVEFGRRQSIPLGDGTKISVAAPEDLILSNQQGIEEVETMTDTSPEMEARYMAMWKNVPPAERLRMGCEMFSAAKELALAGLRHQLGDVDPGEIRRHLFKRLYGSDFAPAELEKIFQGMERMRLAAQQK